MTVTKARRLLNRHVLSLIILILLSVALLQRYPYTIFVRNTTITADWQPPPPLQAHIHWAKHTPLADHLAARNWTKPSILTTFVRPLQANESKHEVFIYATGVHMGHYQRNLTLGGCIIGNHVFRAKGILGDIFICETDHPVRDAPVSLVLKRDEHLAQNMRGVRLGRNMTISLTASDIRQLPNDAVMHVPGRAAEHVMLASSARVTHVSPRLARLRARPRYKVCMATQMKTFAHLLRDWVDYHRRLGVDQVYVLDNDSDADLASLVADVPGVEVVFWPFQKSQTQAMSYLLVAARERCEWVLLSDADEYVLLGADGPAAVGGIREYVDAIDPAVQAVKLHYIGMGPSGHYSTPAGPVAEEYLYKHHHQKENGKTIARTDFWWVCSGIHQNRARGGMPEGAAVSGAWKERPRAGDDAVLVHFQHRSFEEMNKKRTAGSGSVADRHFGKRAEKQNHAAAAYVKIRHELRYTYFRDVWRVVVGRPMTRVLVKSGSGESVVL